MTGFVDSNSEESDSDLSDVADMDSDLEAEKQVVYSRAIYKEDAAKIRKLNKDELQAGQKRKRGPTAGLKLQFIHGCVLVHWFITLIGKCISKKCTSTLITKCQGQVFYFHYKRSSL